MIREGAQAPMTKTILSMKNRLFGSTWLGRNKAGSGRVGIAVGPDGLAIALVNAVGNVSFCHFYEPGDDMGSLVKSVVKKYDWENIPCSVVLHPAYYQLFLAESPAVNDAEMTSAVRWKVKELLDFPLEDAAIEHFLLPDDAYRGRQKMLYASALRKTALKSLIEPFVASGLDVDCIEISELAIHNIVSRLPVAGGGIAMVQLHDGEGFINLVEDGSLYLTRRLDVGLDKFRPGEDNAPFFDTLFLEIQRSLDYYESQLGKGIITRLFYSPGTVDTSAIGDFLSAQLGLNVSPLNVVDLDICTATPSDHILHSTSAIGAALGPYNLGGANSAAS